MVRCTFYDRSNQEITSWNYANNLLTYFPDSEWAQVRGVDNVIDVMIINWDRKGKSCSPQLFKKHSNEQPWNCSGRSASYPLESDSDQQNPFNICPLNSSDFNSLPFIATATNQGSEKYGTWTPDESTTAAMAYDLGVSPSEYTATWKITSLSLLYHGMEMIQAAMMRGYQLFEPNNLFSYKNWNSVKRGDWHIYALTMYLDAKSAALNMGCFNDNLIGDNQCINKLFNSQFLSDKNVMKELANQACSTSVPSYTVLPQGRYYMGTTIYNTHTTHKLMLLPDGNWTLFQLSSNSDITQVSKVWSTETANKEYYRTSIKKYAKFHRPELSIQSDGNVVLYSRDGKAMWATGTNDKGKDINVHCAWGRVHVFDAGDPLKTIWASLSNWGSWASSIMKYPALAINGSTCSVSDPNKRMSNYNTLLSKQAAYCMDENNMEKDPKCMTWFRGDKLDNDDDRVIKNKVADYVKSKYCTSEEAVSKSSDAIKKMCSCSFGYSTAAKELIKAGGTPYCSDPTCLEFGFRDLRNAPTATVCNTCINKLEITNALNAQGIAQSCNMQSTVNNTNTNTSSTNTESNSKTEVTTPSAATTTTSTTSTSTAATPATPSATTPSATTATTSTAATPATPSATNQAADELKKKQQLYYMYMFLIIIVTAVVVAVRRRNAANQQMMMQQMMMNQGMFPPMY